MKIEISTFIILNQGSVYNKVILVIINKTHVHMVCIHYWDQWSKCIFTHFAPLTERAEGL